MQAVLQFAMEIKLGAAIALRGRVKLEHGRPLAKQGLRVPICREGQG